MVTSTGLHRNTDDARRGIKENDLVKLYNDRCNLCGIEIATDWTTSSPSNYVLQS